MSSAENSFSGIPYVGSRVSLVSNSDIRYVGTLYTIDPRTMTVALKDVSSLGTENRFREKGPVPPSDHVYPFIIFHGPDIVDLQFLPQPPTSTPSEPSYPPLLSPTASAPAIIPSVEQTPFRDVATGEDNGEQPLVEEPPDNYVEPVNTRRGGTPQKNMFRQLPAVSLSDDKLTLPRVSSAVSHPSFSNGSLTSTTKNKNDQSSRDNESSSAASLKAKPVPAIDNKKDHSTKTSFPKKNVTVSTPVVSTFTANQQNQAPLRRPHLRAWGPPPVAAASANSRILPDNSNGRHNENINTMRTDSTATSNKTAMNKKIQSRPNPERKVGPVKSDILQRPDRHGTASKSINAVTKSGQAGPSAAASSDAGYSKSNIRRPAPPGLRKQGSGIKVPKEDYDFEAMMQTFEKTRLETDNFPPIEVRYDKSRSFFDELVPENEMRGERNAAQQRAVDYETFGETGMRASMRRKVGTRGRARRGNFGRGRGRFRGRESIRHAPEGVPSDSRQRVGEE